MSRTIIDIPEPLLHEADELCRRLGVSRAELLRRALRDFVRGQPPVRADGFGLWAESKPALIESPPAARPAAGRRRSA